MHHSRTTTDRLREAILQINVGIRRSIELSELAYIHPKFVFGDFLRLNEQPWKSECLKVRVEDPYLYTAIQSPMSVVFIGLKYCTNISIA